MQNENLILSQIKKSLVTDDFSGVIHLRGKFIESIAKVSLLALDSFDEGARGGYATKGDFINHATTKHDTYISISANFHIDVLYLLRLVTDSGRRFAFLLALDDTNPRNDDPNKSEFFALNAFGLVCNPSSNLIIALAATDSEANIAYARQHFSKNTAVINNAFNAYYFAGLFAAENQLIRKQEGAQHSNYPATFSVALLKRTGFYKDSASSAHVRAQTIVQLNDRYALPRRARFLAEINGLYLCILPNNQIIQFLELLPEIIKDESLMLAMHADGFVEEIKKQTEYLAGLKHMAGFMIDQMERVAMETDNK